MALLLADHEKPIISKSVAPSIFNKGSYAIKSIIVKKAPSPSPPKPVLIITPTIKGSYGVVLFFHGFWLQNSFYSELLNHVASHGYIIVAPQLYEIPISGPQEIDSAARVADWLELGLQPHLPENVRADIDKLALAGHSRGGKAAFALALGHGKPTLRFRALLGVDPVAGATKWSRPEPHILSFVPESFDMSVPAAVIGSGLGAELRYFFTPPCAPDGLGHGEFYIECCPPRAHFVARDYGHMDVLDDNPPGLVGGLSGCVCKNGAGPRDRMRRATGGIAVAFFRAYLHGDDSDLEAIVGNPGLAPAELDTVEFVRA